MYVRTFQPGGFTGWGSERVNLEKEILMLQVLFAFMVGLHNLYWYYGSQKIKMDLNGTLVSVHAAKAFQG